MNVTWWLSVSLGGRFPSALWTRTAPMQHLPDVGDVVLYLGTEEEPGGAINGWVHRRHWQLDGSAHLTFRQVVIDPADYMPPMPSRDLTYWWTDRDPEIEPLLRASGWAEYRP